MEVARTQGHPGIDASALVAARVSWTLPEPCGARCLPRQVTAAMAALGSLECIFHKDFLTLDSLGTVPGTGC